MNIIFTSASVGPCFIPAISRSPFHPKNPGDENFMSACLHCLKLSNLLLFPCKISLGAIFSEEQKDTSIELAFKYAVYKINKDRSILPKTTLVYDIQYVPDSTDSFRTSKKVCKQIENGVTAIFGKQQKPFLFMTYAAAIPWLFFLSFLLLKFRTPLGSAAFASHPIHLRSFRYTSFRDTIWYWYWC